MSKKTVPQKTGSRDPRTPVSVTRKGRVTVRIFDAELYAENIAQYYNGDEKPSTSKQQPPTYPKRKQSSRFDWTVPLGDYMTTKKGA